MNVTYKKDPSFTETLINKIKTGISSSDNLMPYGLRDIRVWSQTDPESSDDIRVGFSWECLYCTFGAIQLEILEQVISIRDTHMEYMHPDDDPVVPADTVETE